MAIAAPISGTLSDRIGSRLLSAPWAWPSWRLGLFLLSRLGAATRRLAAYRWALAVAGLGHRHLHLAQHQRADGRAPRQRQGIASGMLATARNVGMVLGVGLAGAIFTTVLARAGAGADPVAAQSSAALFVAVRTSLLVAAGVAVAGVCVSAIRGN